MASATYLCNVTTVNKSGYVSAIFDVIDLSGLSTILAEKLKFLVDLSGKLKRNCRSFMAHSKVKSDSILWRLI